MTKSNFKMSKLYQYYWELFGQRWIYSYKFPWPTWWNMMLNEKEYRRIYLNSKSPNKDIIQRIYQSLVDNNV